MIVHLTKPTPCGVGQNSQWASSHDDCGGVHGAAQARLWPLHHRSTNLEVIDDENRRSQVSTATAVSSRNPAYPLRRIDDPSVLRHLILQTLAAVVAAADVDVKVVAARIPLGFEMCLSTETAFLRFSAFVASAGIGVPGGGLPAIAIVLREIHLRTASRRTRVAVATDATVRTAGVGQVEIVVYISVCS